MKFLRIIFIILTISLMAVIFRYSSMPADESTERSYEVGLFIGKLVIPDFDKLSDVQQLEYADSIDYYVRKGAHAVEYLILGVLCSLTLYFCFLECPYLVFFLAWLISVLYAESDEIHQSYVPGRACMIKDVLIDSSGALIGVLLVTIIFSLIIRRKRNNKAGA